MSEITYLGIQNERKTGKTEIAFNGSLLELVTLIAIASVHMEDERVSAERILDLAKMSLPKVREAKSK